MAAGSQAQIPRYYLYGDQGADVELDFLHIEAIRERSGPHDWRIRPHSHPDHMQVLIVREGGGQIRVEDRTLAIEPLAVMVIPAGVVHQIDFHAGTDGFVVTAALGCLKAASANDARLEAAAAHPAVYALAGTGLDTAAVEESFALLHREFIWSAPGRRTVIMAQYMRILVTLLRLAVTRDDQGAATSSRDHDLLVRYRALLERHFKEERNLGFYADALAVTRARLNAACKSRAGKTASDLLHERIVIEAKRYLVYSESSVAQVAHMTGFDDPAYFNRFFAQRAGVSPGTFRKQMQRQQD